MTLSKKIFSSIFYLLFIILIAPCGLGTSPEAFSINNISDLNVIEIKLAWQKGYDSTHFFDALFCKAFAVLPPDHQPHFKQRLTFNHFTQTITDSYQHFTGANHSTMRISEVIRGPGAYNQFKDFLEKRKFIHKVTRKMMVGPARAVITFLKNDSSAVSAYFFDENISGKEYYELSSPDFSLFLASLREDREENPLAEKRTITPVPTRK